MCSSLLQSTVLKQQALAMKEWCYQPHSLHHGNSSKLAENIVATSPGPSWSCIVKELSGFRLRCNPVIKPYLTSVSIGQRSNSLRSQRHGRARVTLHWQQKPRTRPLSSLAQQNTITIVTITAEHHHYRHSRSRTTSLSSLTQPTVEHHHYHHWHNSL